MEQIQRMPRPEGTTLLCMEIYKARTDKKKKEKKEFLLKHLVNVYTMNGFRINGYSLSLSQFSNLLGVKQDRIQNILFEKATTLQAFSDPDKLRETSNTLASMCTTWAIQDRGLIQSQVETMLRAQQGTYKPFISAEVRQTLSALLQSNKQIAEIFKTFYSQGGININLTQNNQKQENYLTIDRAYEIASESTPKPLKPSDPTRAQILSDSTLKAIAEDNTIEEASNILRQYEHLDNSGWEKKRAQTQLTDAEGPRPHHPQQENNHKEVVDTIVDINKRVKTTIGSGIPTDMSIIGDSVLDSIGDTEYQEYQEAEILQEEKTPSELAKKAGKGIGKPAALFLGTLPSTEALEPSQVEVPDGCIAPSVARFPKKKRPQDTTTKRPSNRTLSGIKLGQKVARTGTGNESEGPNTEKPDNLDRHLNSDHRRAIPRIQDDSLPSRS